LRPRKTAGHRSPPGGGISDRFAEARSRRPGDRVWSSSGGQDGGTRFPGESGVISTRLGSEGSTAQGTDDGSGGSPRRPRRHPSHQIESGRIPDRPAVGGPLAGGNPTAAGELAQG